MVRMIKQHVIFFFSVWIIILCTLTVICPSEQMTQGPQTRALKLHLLIRPPQMPVPPSSRPSSASKAPKRLFSAPYQKSRIDFEVFNAWIYNLASSFSALSNSLSEGSGARPQTVQLKSGVEGFGGLSEEPVFPAFRFYNPGAHAYLAKRNTSKEVVTQDRDPFSNQIEWEWIPQPKSLGAFLRHKASKMFLCFNRHGKPTVQVGCSILLFYAKFCSQHYPGVRKTRSLRPLLVISE
uniref:DPPIV_N domain-containing protein n=1 Tax=Mesocestoides corti TaxID=53468 RepID=A0A5K3FIW0_MESCO